MFALCDAERSQLLDLIETIERELTLREPHWPIVHVALQKLCSLRREWVRSKRPPDVSGKPPR
jgi:hypothetical protein